MRDFNHRRSSDKISAEDEQLFHEKNCHFPSFSFGEHDFFSLIEPISFIDPLHHKTAKA